MKKATTISVDIQFTQPDKVTPLNITGAGLRFMIKTALTVADTDALVSKQPTTNITDAPLGRCSTTITANEANNLPNNVPLYCEAMAVYGSGEVVRTETQQFVLINNLIKALTV